MALVDIELLLLILKQICFGSFKNITVDKMILLGEGQDAYKSIAQMVLPFLEVAKDLGFPSKGNEESETKTKRKRTPST